MDAVPDLGGSGALLGGRYEVGDLVGLGGTARVHRARDRAADTTVAVKIFPPGSAAGPGGDGSRELALLSGMQHPGLVGVHDSGIDDDGRPFVVMDFVDGQSLATRLRAGVLSAPAAARLGAALADALAYVHARGIVHRDVKPGNVLLDGEGRPQLTDFGIARLIDATRVTATGLVVGTAAFMAPEQVRGEVVGPPADVYALGLLLLEAATGRREFEGAALESAIARLHRSPVIPADLPEPLASTIRRMTATDPSERPTAPDVATALRALPEPHRNFGAGFGRGPDGALSRRLVSAGALATLAASVVAGMVLLGGADTSAGAADEPVVQVAGPVPALIAAPPSPTTTPAVVEEAVAVAPTTQRAPVPVAMSKRARPVPATRTVTRTVAEKSDEKSKDHSSDSKDKDGKGKSDKGDKGESSKDEGGDQKKDKDHKSDKGDKGDKDKGGKKGNSGKGGSNSGKGKSG
ncbi:protein kinase [Pseudonocardia sp. DSM 45834]|uniref:non-specific serine/threonine protein kinase n=2 Tax=Pseudonocardia charpentierae TaxID=3075545 RepID=A0ABU2N5T1_9PSEU|nr:protein kinase [Pseudonocardia sp. DSM 45834]